MPNVFFKFNTGRLVNTPLGKMVIKSAMYTSLGNSYEVFLNKVAGMGMTAIYCEEILCKYNNGEKEENENNAIKFKIGDKVKIKDFIESKIGTIDAYSIDEHNWYLVIFDNKISWFKEDNLTLVINNRPIQEKPPIGLVSKHIRLAQRKEEIKQAIIRYMESGRQIKEDWIEEYNEIAAFELERAKDYKQTKKEEK